MAAWDITTAGAAFEFETTLLTTPSALIPIDTNHFFVGYTGSGSDGFVSTLEVNTSTWAVTESGTLEHDTQNASFNSAVQIDANHFAVFYLGSTTTTDGFVQTFEVNTTTWAVTTSAARFLFDTDVGSYNMAVMIDANHIINFWAGPGSDGFVQVFTVNTTTWAVTTAAASLEFDTVIGQHHSALQVDTNHFINFYAGNGSDGFVEVFTVNTTTWAVTTAAARLEFDTQLSTFNSAFKVDTNHFINFWGDTSADGKVQTFTVNTTTWAVTTAAALLEFDTQDYQTNGKTSVTQIDSNHFLHVWAGPDTAAGSAYDGFAQVFEVNTTTWAVTTAGAPFEYDTTQGEYNVISPLIAGEDNKFLHVFAGSGDDGFAEVLSVEIPNYPPTVVLNSPVEIMDSYSEGNQSSTSLIGATASTRWGQSFTGNGGILEAAKFYLQNTGTGTSDVFVSIYAHSGTFGTSSVGTGAALATSEAIDPSEIGASLELVTFNFTGANRITLDNGTNYVVAVTKAQDGSGAGVSVGTDTSSPTHGGNSVEFESVWTANSADVIFYVYERPSVSDTTPTLDFTATDPEGDSSRFHVQVDTSEDFDSQTGSEVLDQTNTTGTTGIGFGDTGSGRDYLAQGFIPTVETITAFSFRVADKDGSANVGYLVWIDAANANSEPTGTVNVGIGGVTEITNAEIVTGALTKYDLASPVTVTPGTRYCIVMVPWNTSTDTKVSSYHDVMSSTANPYTSGRRVHLDGSFATPTAPDSGNADILFEVYGYNTYPLIDRVSGGSEVVETLTSSQVWEAPEGVTSIQVESWGAGAGGKAGAAGGGAGGGAYAKTNSITVIPGKAYRVTVGAGGAGRSFSGSPGDGNPGGDSYFGDGSENLAKGGSGPTSTTGAAGGLASSSVGDTKYNGGDGGDNDLTFSTGGGGGGGAGSTGAGGAGGDGAFPTVGAGGTGTSVGGGNGGTIAGGNTAPGSDYGGGASATENGAQDSSAGGNGAVKITYTAGSTGFANPDNGGDTDPFNDSENIQYTVQGADILDEDTYYWRVRAIDPSGGNAWGNWSSTNSFDIQGALAISVSDSISITENKVLELNSYINKSDSIGITENNQTVLISDILVSDSITTTDEVTTIELNSNIGITEPISVSEAVTILIPFLLIAINDAVTVSENLNIEETSFINVSDSVGVAESINVSLTNTISLSDSVTVADSVNVALVHLRSVSDAVTVTENIIVSLEIFINKSEAITITDTPNVTLLPLINVSDNIGVSESVNIALVHNIAVNDIVGTSENTTLFLEIKLSVSDTIVVNEATNIATAYTLAVTDTINSSDSVIVKLDILPIISDAISLSENIELLLSVLINKSDQITVAESTRVELISDINVSDIVATSENVTVENPIDPLSVSDAISVTESATIVLLGTALNPYTTDSIIVSESANISVSDPQVIVTDSISITELIDPEVELQVSVNDSISVAESIQLTLVSNINVYDIFSVSENNEHFILLQVNVSESITVAEVLEISLDDLTISTSETIGVSDPVVGTPIGMGPMTYTEGTELEVYPITISVNDVIDIFDSINSNLTLDININDLISISETFDSELENNVFVNDTITVTESIALIQVYGINVNENINVTENVTLVVSDPKISVSETIITTEALGMAFVHFLSVSDTISVTDSVLLTPPHVPDFIYPKFIFVEGRLAYLIVTGNIPHYIFV